MLTIARYLAREVLQASFFVFAALTTLFALFDLINELDSLGKGAYGFLAVLLYVMLNIPGHLYDLLPVAALIGSLLALSRLVANSELTVMFASGLSMRRVALWMVAIGVFFGLLTFLVGEVVAPATDRYAEQMKLKATHQVVAQAFRSGLWVRDHHQFINVRVVTPDGDLRDVSIYEFDPAFRLQQVLRAGSGHFMRDGIWQLRDISTTVFSDAGVSLQRRPDLVWQSVLTPAIMNVLLIAPEKMSAEDLWAYVAHLNANHQPTERYEIALWSKLLYPLAAPVMLLLALPFAWHRPRAGGVGVRVFIGIMTGLGFHLINRLFAYIGLLNDWQPWVSVSVPTLLFLLLGIGMLLRMEQR